MKKVNFVSTLIISSLALINSSCSSDDDIPEIVNEEELITTATITLTPKDGGNTVTLKSIDLDGDGPNEPVVSISDNLEANEVYYATIVLLNETTDPAEDITIEVLDEAEDHQFFYSVSNDLNITTTYNDEDENGNPIGVNFTLNTAAASTGNFTLTLRHQPTKPNTNLTDAGGETDISTSYSITIE